jgi:hypothetical protein
MHGEDATEFEIHRKELLADLAPVGTRETVLAERIVRLSWQLQRVDRLQTRVLDDLIAKETSNPLVKLAESLLAEGIDLMGNDAETNPDLAVGRAIAKDFSGDSILDRLSIQEQQIEDRWFKAMHASARAEAGNRQEAACRRMTGRAKQSQFPAADGRHSPPCMTAKQSQFPGSRSLPPASMRSVMGPAGWICACGMGAGSAIYEGT